MLGSGDTAGRVGGELADDSGCNGVSGEDSSGFAIRRRPRDRSFMVAVELP